MKNKFFYLEISIILGFALFPVLFNLPFRDNVYLTWEGTYRLHLGQVPYKDFGMPIGFGFFIIPLIFFKIFGPYLFSLVYAQVFANLITLFVFRAILKLVGLTSYRLLFSLLIFCLSYSFIYFWPWYNNMAYVYEILAIYFTMLFIFKEKGKVSLAYLFFSALFTFLSVFTKQDYGGVTVLFCGALLVANSFFELKSIKYIPFYLLCMAGIALIFILPFLKYDFGYWFNYGQAPHQSRLHLSNFLNEIIGGSHWEKFYLLVILFILLSQDIKVFIKDKKMVFLALLAVGMVLQTLITKVTSRLPSDTTTYFHAFAFAFIISSVKFRSSLERWLPLSLMFVMIMFWWSAMYWKYANRFFKSSNAESATSKKAASQAKWELSGLRSFHKVNLPPSTIEGIRKILNNPVTKKPDLKVLNMSELTPLAYELKYEPEPGLPLWYHLNIGMFERELQMINSKIKNNEYDLVLFEEIPNLDNFYPEDTRKVLKEYYQLEDTFAAPRKDSISFIEVYYKK